MLNYMRYHLLNQSMGEKYGEKIATIPIPKRLMITALYMLQVCIAYGLMLVVMSYNFMALFILVLGLAVGNFITSYLTLKKIVSKTYSDDLCASTCENVKAGESAIKR